MARKNRLYKSLLFILMLASCIRTIQACAQSANSKGADFTTIRGVVKDSLLKPLASITVAVIKADDTSVVVHQLTDTAGNFSFTNMPSGNYHLTVSASGFRMYQGSMFTVNNDRKILQIPGITLYQQTQTLKNVTVTSSFKKFIDAGAGKLVLNVEQSAAAAGSSAFDLLQRAPGVTVDQNDNILLRGSATVNVMIDGRMTYLSAQQLSDLLKSIPAENISKIEVITNPSAQYDAAGNTGIINIVTKKSNKPGHAADINAGAGFGHYFLHTENITGNIRTKRFNVFGSLGYNVRHIYRISSKHQLTNNSSQSIIDRTVTDIILSKDFTFKAGADVYLSKKQQLGFVVNGLLEDWNRSVNGPSTIADISRQTIATVQNRTIADEPYHTGAYDINYQFLPDTSETVLTANADYIRYREQTDGYISNQQFDKYGDSSQPFQKLLYHQPSYITIRSVKADVTHSILTYKMKAGLKYSSVSTDNDYQYDSLENGQHVYAASLSDHFIYTERIAAAYISAEREWKRTSFSLGLRAEHTFSDGNSISTGIDTKRHYTNLFPTFSLDRQCNDNNKIGIAVSRRINRPSYNSLNPVRYFYDKYFYYQGNPYLKPEYAWLVSLSYTWLDKYIVTANYTRTNQFSGHTARIDSTGVLVSSYVNYPYAGNCDVQLIVPVKLNSFWQVSALTDLSYYYYPLEDAGTVRNINKLSIDLTLSQTFTAPVVGTFELNTHYTSPQLDGGFVTKYFLSVDGGYKRTIVKKKLDIRCAFTDLLRTNRSWGYSILSHVQSSYNATRDNRSIKLIFIYHIGGKLSGGKSHSIEEENRL